MSEQIKFETPIECEPFEVICIDDSLIKQEHETYRKIYGEYLPHPVKDKPYTVIATVILHILSAGAMYNLYIFKEFEYKIFGHRACWNKVFFVKPENAFAEKALETAIAEGKKMEGEIAEFKVLLPVR